MAIRVWERWQDRDGGADETGVRTLTRGWGAETTDRATGPGAVIDAVIAFDASAALFAGHPEWPTAVRRGINAKPDGGPLAWLVNATYSSAPFTAASDGGSGGGGAGGGTGGGTTLDALQSLQTRADLRPPTLSISRKEVTELLEFDAVATEADGTPKRIVNVPCGEPFDPPPEVFRSRHVLTWKFRRTPAQLFWGVRAAWMDTVNSKPIIILNRLYPAFSLRCTDYSLDTEWDTGDQGLALYFALTVQAEFKPDLWKIQILNTGRRRNVGSSLDPKLVAIVGEDGQPVAEPVPLTAAGIPVRREMGDTFHYVEVDGYLPADWLGGKGSLTALNAILS